MVAVFYALWGLLSLTAIIHLLIHKREPSSTIAWLFFVTVVPVAGSLLFLIFGPQRLEREAFKRKRELEKILDLSNTQLVDPTTSATEAGTADQLPSADTAVLRLAREISEYGVTSGNAVELLADPARTLTAMQEAIDSAKKFIHLEYYIISSDEVTEQLFQGLERAARRGVEVRILYDSFGSLSLKRIYFRKLTQAGVKIAGFLPFSLLPQRINVNFRNHRKILIVDGTTAFTGGTNIGRQYLGRRTKSQWHDYAVKVQGPVCRQLQDVFAKDWHFTTQEDLFHAAYYPEPSRQGDAIIQVLESGPDTRFAILHQALFLMLNQAQREIRMTTPYFIPDPAIMMSLMVAALRGVKVQLVLPLKTDAPLVRYASRSFYDGLLRAGVEIYEYRPRVLHAKVLTIDNKWTMLGSANMDIRSFRLNFELNLFIYGASTTAQADTLFAADLQQSERVTLERFQNRAIGQQMLENACRLLSPVL